MLPLIILNCHLKGSQHITVDVILHFTMIKWNEVCKVFMEFPESTVHMGIVIYQL